MFLISVGACQETKNPQKPDLTGTWVYSQPAKKELVYTMTVDGKKVDTSLDDRQEDRFYLVFYPDGEFIEYKVGFGFRSEYRVEHNTLYIDSKPTYEIMEITSDYLTLKYLSEPKTITYSKTTDDVSDFEIIN